jgi:RNA polymerase sigma-70 factor (ECF subfamily)
MVLTHNHAEAEDLVQETYLRAMPAIKRLRPESNIKGWFFKILRNAWLNQLRKRRNGGEISLTDMEDGTAGGIAEPSKSSYDALVSEMEREQVQAAIQKLPEKFREIILLRELEELPYHEIASLLDCPVGTVMSRLARARLKLRELLTLTTHESRAGKAQDEGLQ